MMVLMNRFDHFFYQALQKKDKQGLKRNLIFVETIDSTHLNYHGKNYINFSSNDYLGLSQDARLICQGRIWQEKYGAGSGASRLITGNTAYYQDVEVKLAQFLGTEAALIFPSGWQTNVGVIACLLENLPKPLWVLTDKLNHASLHYGCKAGQSKQIRFRHNDMNHLKERLEAIVHEQGTRIILTETLFSMDGDMVDISTLRAIADDYHAFLFLDDAHATGIYGDKGQGLAPVVADLTMGTFSKSWGSFGAYIAGSKLLCEWLLNYCSAFIHTTALPPSVIGSIAAALEIMPLLSAKRNYLNQQAMRVKRQLQLWGWKCGPSVSQIIPIMIGSVEQVLFLTERLKKKNIWVMPIRPPTVPPQSSRLRLTLSAAHTEEEIDCLLEAFHQLSKY